MGGRKYALIGRQISHSLSPELHGIFAGFGEGYDYELRETPDEAGIPALLGDLTYHGFNVTSPYKRAVIPYLDALTPKAEVLQAVNTILRREDGSLEGHNTDVYGVKQMFTGRVEGRKVLILGSGGAASATCEGLRQLGAREIVIASRGKDPGVPNGVGHCTYEELRQHPDAEVLINATPVGMGVNAGQSPLDRCETGFGDFRKLKLAADLIYEPYRTKFLLDAEEAGIPVVSGLRMLVCQGIRAAGIWGELAEEIPEEEICGKAMEQLLRDQLNIIVIGMPGCGKTSISRRLAGILGRRFADIDREILRESGRKPSEIIESEGEEAFRQIETEMLRKYCRMRGLVIATGGGAVIREENRRLFRENSITVYIRRTAELLSTRDRPISKRVGTSALYEQRAPFYEAAADLTIFNNRRFGTSHGRDGRMNSYQYDLNRFAHRMARMVDDRIRQLSEE